MTDERARLDFKLAKPLRRDKVVALLAALSIGSVFVGAALSYFLTARRAVELETRLLDEQREVMKLEALIAQQNEEIARLRGTMINPSTLDEEAIESIRNALKEIEKNIGGIRDALEEEEVK